MNVLDSSGWIEYLQDGKNYHNFSACAEDLDNLIVPTVVIFEVMKYVSLNGTEANFSNALKTLRSGIVVPLTEEISINAVALSREHKLPLADSLILATSLSLNG